MPTQYAPRTRKSTKAQMVAGFAVLTTYCALIHYTVKVVFNVLTRMGNALINHKK